MIQSDLEPKSIPRTTIARRLAWFCHLLILALLVSALPARGDDEEDRYLHIVDTIQQADALGSKGKTAAALSKYQEAQSALQTFRRTDHDWNPRMVEYRLKYVADKIDACSEKPTAPGQSSAANGSTTGAGKSVKLLEAGTEPRTVLRLHPKPGDKQTLTMKMKMAMDMKIGAMESPAVKLPSMVMTMDVTVQDVASDGDIHYEMVMTDATVADEPGVMPQVIEAIKTAFSGLKGLSGSGTVSSRGINKATEIKTPPGADPQIQQAMDQMKQSFGTLATPLPEEAVGPGAKWEAKAPIKSQGMTFDQTASYELVSIEGEKLIAKTALTQFAANQKVENPAMPGLKVDLTKMTGTGTGELTLDLTRLLPQNVTLDSHSDLAMGMNVAGQKQTMSMKLDLSLQVEAK